MQAFEASIKVAGLQEVKMKKSLKVIASALLAAAVFVGCSSKAAFKDGTYEGEAQGFKAPIKVSVVVKGGKVSDVTVLENGDTAELFGKASEAIIKEVKEENSADALTTVSGATYSSKGLIDAIKAALEKAK